METKYKVILGSISLYSSEDGIKDDGTIAQSIANILVKELSKYGVDEVEVDLDTSIENTIYKIGDIVECIDHIDDGYTEIGDYNVIFPPPTYVKIVEIKEDKWKKYGVKVLREKELPKELQGKQFRAVMSIGTKKGQIKFIGNKQSFFDGDEGIDDKYFDNIYWMPDNYIRSIKYDG